MWFYNEMLFYNEMFFYNACVFIMTCFIIKCDFIMKHVTHSILVCELFSNLSAGYLQQRQRLAAVSVHWVTAAFSQ